jgi:hypothetical protein
VVVFVRYRDGKIVEHWNIDQAGLCSSWRDALLNRAFQITCGAFGA